MLYLVRLVDLAAVSVPHSQIRDHASDILNNLSAKGAGANASGRDDYSAVPWEPSQRRLLHIASFHKGGSAMVNSLLVLPMITPEFSEKANVTVVGLSGLDRSLRQIACGKDSNITDTRPDAEEAFEVHMHVECGVCRLRYELLEQASCGTSVRAVVMLHDPRDMVLSATAYHQQSGKAWLNQTAIGGEAAGKSYRQSLLDVLDAGGHRAAVQHEILPPSRHPTVMRNVIRSMVDYVDLYEQRKAVGDHRIALFCDKDLVQQASPVAKQELERAVLHLHGAKQAELTMDLFQEALRKNASRDIARHGRGANAMGWRGVFDEELHRTFRAVFGNAVERLGYPSQ